mgnify:CR=1 FL=1
MAPVKYIFICDLKFNESIYETQSYKVGGTALSLWLGPEFESACAV